jgi:serine/threonine-protein kinase
MVALEAGAVIAGRYQLERSLAQGGMGAVWVARHLQLDTEVAIKFMAPEHAASSDSELRARFEREAKASARLKLPNVIQVHDYGIEDGTPYLVMELLEGEDLEQRLSRAGRLTPAATLAVVEPVCKALGHAHGVGLIHRDLKPGNIFLARHGGEEIVKILDFGIAKDTGLGLVNNATKTGTLLGSPQYMSPEQVRRSKEIDGRSDLWSLGVIVFRCLTGRLPFQSEEIGDLLVAICSEDIPTASRIVPELGPVMDELLARALAREPVERFQSAQAFAHAFRAATSATGWRPGLEIKAALPARVPGAPIGTLAPSGGTVASTPGRGRAVGPALALLGAAGTLGLIVFTALRSATPDAPPTPAAEPAAPPPAAAPAPAESASAGAADRLGSAEGGAADAVAPPATTPEPPDASAPAPSPQKPAPPRAPAPTKPRKPGHDPLDKM